MVSDRSDAPARSAAAIAGLVFVSIVAYLPAFRAGFTADDFFILSRVKEAGVSGALAYFQAGFFDYYRPIAFLTHAVDWQVWGLNAAGFHLTNVLLHAASTVLVCLTGRRLAGHSAATVGALFFALHPASHEAVYWIAARFDLLATFFTLVAVWCLAGDGRAQRTLGVAAFALGLLSKESAISLLLIAPAWDVFVARRDVRSVLGRILPLIAVVAAYAIVRSFGADLDAAGGDRRLPKAVMSALMLMAIVALATRNGGPTAEARPAISLPWWLLPGAGVLAGVALAGPVALATATQKALGFSAYAFFYLLSPIVFPSPPAEWFSPTVSSDAMPGLLAVWATLALIGFAWRSLARHRGAMFLCVFVLAALLPVSSMPGGLRYLYLAAAGVSLLIGWLLTRVAIVRPWLAAATITVVLVVSLTQLLQAGRAWRAGSDMTRNGVALMAPSLQPCGTKDVILLTTPVGIGGVYANFYYEAFDVLTGCSPRLMVPLLRVIGADAHVNATVGADQSIELLVPNYRGNIVASPDLRNFTIPIRPGEASTIDTPAGRIETFAQGTTQVFRVVVAGDWRAAALFYYSNGAVKPLF